MTSLPFAWLAVSFAVGSLFAHFMAAFSSKFYLPLIFLIPALGITRRKKGFEFLLLLTFFFLGAGFGHFDRTKPPPSLEKMAASLDSEKSVVIFGKVAAEPEIKTRGRKVTVSFVLELSRLNRRKADGKIQVFLFQPGQPPGIGDEIRLWGKIKAVPPALNPGQFDYQQYLKDRDISFLMNVYGAGSMRVMKPAPRYGFRQIVARARQWMGVHIDRIFQEKDRPFIKALILGERKNMDPVWKNDFMKTGTSHLLAISGLNIALAAGSFYMLLMVCGLSQKPAALLAMLATVLQVFIAGLGIPVQRAGIMACFGFLALLLERERRGLNLFFLAFLALLVLDTRSLFNISFQLSFLSLFFLILFSHFWKGRWPWLEALASSTAVMAGTLPLVIYHFNVFAPISIFANLLAIPFFHLALVTALAALGIFWVPGLGFLAVSLSHLFLKWGLAWIHFCAQPGWGYYFLLRPSIFHMILYYAVLAVFLFLWGKMGRWEKRFCIGALTVWIVALGFLFRPAAKPGFEMTVFSAGANEILHVQFGDGSHWLINAGRSKPSDQAEWIVAPYLRSKGIKKLKGILFTDYLKRHTAGYETLRRNFMFEYAAGPFLYKENLMLPESRVIQMRKADRILIPDGSVIEILDHYQGKFAVALSHGGHRFILFPDSSPRFMEKIKETDIVVTGEMAKEGAVTFRVEGSELQVKPFLKF